MNFRRSAVVVDEEPELGVVPDEVCAEEFVETNRFKNKRRMFGESGNGFEHEANRKRKERRRRELTGVIS